MESRHRLSRERRCSLFSCATGAAGAPGAASATRAGDVRRARRVDRLSGERLPLADSRAASSTRREGVARISRVCGVGATLARDGFFPTVGDAASARRRRRDGSMRARERVVRFERTFEPYGVSVHVVRRAGALRRPRRASTSLGFFAPVERPAAFFHPPSRPADPPFLPPRLQANKVVVVLQGRYAGKKAVIVKNYDEGTSSRPYGHALVCGLATYPRKVTKKMTKKDQDKHSRVKTFIKTVNYNHLMPTRYTLDVDLKATVTPDVLENPTKKVAARKEAKKVLEERFKTGKSRWFFTRLAF